MNDAKNVFEGATFVWPDGKANLSDQPWQAHPAFAGVWMKTVVPGARTGGRLSCHLVRVERGRAIGLHTHPGSLELHEVLAGQGVCRLLDMTADYTPGVCLAIPEGVEHTVEAGDEDLYLLAKFTPAAG